MDSSRGDYDTACHLASTCQTHDSLCTVTGLRERRHLETKQLLVTTAFDLFVERGFTDVTMEEIAQAAGLSRSTLYRRFPTKEDLVLDVPTRWIVVFDDAVEALPLDVSIGDAIGRSVLAVAGHIDRHTEIVRTAYQILDQSPTLQQSGLVTSTWIRRIAEVFTRFSSADDETSLVLAGAYFGAIDATVLHWATTDAATSVSEKTARLLARLAPILPPDRAA